MKYTLKELGIKRILAKKDIEDVIKHPSWLRFRLGGESPLVVDNKELVYALKDNEIDRVFSRRGTITTVLKGDLVWFEQVKL